jgi:hypothetical protein
MKVHRFYMPKADSMHWYLRIRPIYFFTGSTVPLGPVLCFSVSWSFYRRQDSWTSDQFVAKPLPKHRATQTENKHIHTLNIHALCGIRTYDPSFRASEDSICLRPHGYCDRLRPIFNVLNFMTPLVRPRKYRRMVVRMVKNELKGFGENTAMPKSR